jgi:hypothetical protein
MRSEDRKKGCNSLLTTTLNTLWYVRSTIFFCKLLFSWIEFQKTYNSRSRERYEDDPSTHLDFDLNLWMKAWLFGGPDKNRVYWFSNTTAENLQTTRSISIVRSLQSISSTQSQEFAALQQQTIHLTEKYERVSADCEELRWMVIDMRSQMGGTCVPPFGHMVSGTTSLLLLLL